MGVSRVGRSEAVHPAGGGVRVAQAGFRHPARCVRRHCGQMLQLHRQRLVRPKQEALPYLGYINGVHSAGVALLPVERPQTAQLAIILCEFLISSSDMTEAFPTLSTESSFCLAWKMSVESCTLESFSCLYSCKIC